MDYEDMDVSTAFDFEEQEIKKDLATRTGVMSLDLCLGGGLPSGITEIYGEESTGKTALAACVLSSAQASGMTSMFCASEKYDPPYMKSLGVVESDLILMRGLIEPMVEIASAFLDRDGRRLVVIDSLTAFRSRDEDPTTWGLNVLKMMEELRNVIRVGSLVVVVNQVRSVYRDGKPTSRTESAARRVDDMFDVRIELSRKDVSENQYTMVANIVKSAFGRPGVWTELPSVKGKGVDLWRDYVRVAAHIGVISKKGGHYYFEGKYMANGEDEMVDLLRSDNALFGIVLHKIYDVAGL